MPSTGQGVDPVRSAGLEPIGTSLAGKGFAGFTGARGKAAWTGGTAAVCRAALSCLTLSSSSARWAFRAAFMASSATQAASATLTLLLLVQAAARGACGKVTAWATLAGGGMNLTGGAAGTIGGTGLGIAGAGAATGAMVTTGSGGGGGGAGSGSGVSHRVTWRTNTEPMWR